MSEIVEDISYLSQEIGPRPAGTEEEQQAALYIADQMQKRTGFTANIEDFNTATQPGLVEAICFGAAAVISLLAILLNVFVIPAFFITLACAILYAFELIDRPLLSHAFERGVSQNVVARYNPNTGAQARGRKVVLVANYDSSKVQSELNGGLFNIYPTAIKASVIALGVLPLIWLIRTLFLLHATGGAVVFFNVLSAIAVILALVPVALFFMHKASTYNEAANNNAAGVAAMLEVARIISAGSMSEEEIAATGEARIHGAARAYEEGVVPEGAQLEYAEGLPQTEEERLAQAKSAIASITGQPLRHYEVEHIDFTPLSERDDIESYVEEMDYGEYAYPEDDEATVALEPIEASQSALGAEEEHAAAFEGGSQAQENEMPAAEDAVEGSEAAQPVRLAPTAVAPAAATNEPAWFTTGRAKAVKPEGADEVPIRRSRYADALDAALAASHEHIEEAARMLDEGTIERISQMQRDIEGKQASVRAFDGTPLQDLLSDDAPIAREEDSVEYTEEPEDQTSPTAGLGQGLASTLPVEDLNEPLPEPVAISGAAPDQTVAMDPIDTSKLEDTSSAHPEVHSEQQDLAHDFSKIEAPSRRYREIAVESVIQEDRPVTDAPARYGDNLESGRLPRIVSPAPAAPISVMDEAPVAQSALDQAEQEQEPKPDTISPVYAHAEEEVSVDEKRAALRNIIPSLSGEFAPIKIDESSEEESNEVSKTGSFATASAAVPFTPVGDELVAELAPEERYVEDADDSSFEENTTETGAYAGPDYVDMPESRLSRFFSRFRKKETPEETSATEWLDVDEDFEARAVGAARGSWESFRESAEETIPEIDTTDAADAAGAPSVTPGAIEESSSESENEPEQGSLFEEYEYVDADEEERSWHGGAFSQLRARLMNNEEAEEGAAALIEETEADEVAAAALEDAEVSARESVSVPLVDTTEEARIAEEAKMVYTFRNPDINTEVWFVALGAEYAGNSGMKAFLAEHSADLRGAVIVNLEAMGAGTLSYIEEEGLLFTQKPSSRLKRFLHKASQITGISTATGRIPWRESAASLAMKRGLQAMTLAGMEGEKPALLGQGDDVLENVSEETVQENAQFIVEFIKNI